MKEQLVAEDKSKMSDAEKAVKVEGILNQIIAVNATLQVSFPIHRSVISATSEAWYQCCVYY